MMESGVKNSADPFSSDFKTLFTFGQNIVENRYY